MPDPVSIVVCVHGTGSYSVAPCDHVAGGVYAPSVVTGHVLSDAEYSAFVDASQRFDPQVAGEYFVSCFSAVITLWLFAFGVGLVMRTVRSS